MLVLYIPHIFVTLASTTGIYIVNSVKANNQLLMGYLNKNIDPTHFDIVREVNYYSNKVMIKLRIGNYRLIELKQMTGWWKKITGLHY